MRVDKFTQKMQEALQAAQTSPGSTTIRKSQMSIS
jgi:hypothetical protein